MISGNIFEVFGDSLFGISAEKKVVDSNGEAPFVVADHVSVTAG